MTSVIVKNKSGYLLFCDDVRESIKKENPEIKSVDVVKKMGDGWRNLPSDQKEAYQQKATVDKERYLKEKEQWAVENPGVIMEKKKPKAKREKKSAAPSAAAAEEIVILDHELVQEDAPVVEAPAPTKKATKSKAKVAAATVVVPEVVATPEPEVKVDGEPEKKSKTLNKFQNFCAIQRPKLKAEKPQFKLKDISGELSVMWKALSPQEQDGYAVTA